MGQDGDILAASQDKVSCVLNPGPMNFQINEFRNFGADLRWKAILTAEEDVMADFTGASYDTPLIYSLALEYRYVERQE